MSYKYYVENDRDDVRPDIARFKIMMIQYKETASEAWSRFVESRHWWIVPSTLRCDRTFCRDAFDCYYVDAMDKALSQDQEPLECPLFRHDVLDRWWNAFSRKPDFLFELFMRQTARVLVNYDSYETCHYTADELGRNFPAVPHWMIDLDIPAGIPLPLAPVAYYFASDLKEGADPKRYRRAHYFLKREHMGLVVAFWYNEMYHGGRQWVISPNTINKLRQYCLNLDVVKGVPTGHILNMQMGRRVRDPTYWNIYKAGAAAIPDCHFVDCEPGSGDYLPWMTGGRVELANMKSRRVKLVLRQHRRVQVRRSSPLSLRLLVADLVHIPGLDNYAREYNWLQVDNIRVHDLISKLYGRVRRQEDHIKQLQRELRTTKFDRDGVRAAFEAAEKDLEELRARDRVPRDRVQYNSSHFDPRSGNRGIRNALPNTPEARSPPYDLGRGDAVMRNCQRKIPDARSPFVARDLHRQDINALPGVPRRPPTQTQYRGSIAQSSQYQYHPPFHQDDRSHYYEGRGCFADDRRYN